MIPLQWGVDAVGYVQDGTEGDGADRTGKTEGKIPHSSQ